MSRVDEELSKALEESEMVARSEPGHNVSVPNRHEPNRNEKKAKRSLGLLAALLVMVGGILTLVFTSFEDAAVYAQPIDKVLAEKDRFTGRNLRVQGTLVSGSLKRRDEPCEYRFSIEEKGKSLPVRYTQCIVPDTFQDMKGMKVPVTVEGQINPAGHFDATTIMAKCPSRHDMEKNAQAGIQPPHLGSVPPAAM
jgi:cytochrome c-type biogenesis protein CcmE